jgi:modulator of FtsH protease
MIVFETQIRTGHPAGDQQMLSQLRMQHEALGNVVQVQPMPGGGYHVRCLRGGPTGPQPQQGYGPQYGQQPSAPPPQQPYGGGYGGPPPQAQAYGPSYGQQPPPPQPGYGAGGFAGTAMAMGAPMGGGAAYAGNMPGVQMGAMAQDAAWDEGRERIRYIRKVYGLLAISAVFAIAAGWISTSPLLGTETFRLEGGKKIEVPIIVAVMLEHPQIEYACFGVLFVSVFIASFVSKVRGLNYIALFGVSALMGVELAPMVFVAQVMAGMGLTMTASPVHATFAMVAAIFVGLTAYVFIAKKDFSYLKATLSMGFFVILAGCIVAFAIDSEPFTLAVASAGALLSIGFLLYQTSYIFRNSDMDDPVDDALGLIVQLRNLFMFLLRIFMSRR